MRPARLKHRRSISLVPVLPTLPVTATTSDDGANTRVLNRSYVYAPDGTEAAHYDKMHLFRYQNEREHYDEARVLRAGERPVALALDGLPGLEGQALRLGLSICYDLRFPELYRAMKADLLLVPSAFTLKKCRPDASQAESKSVGDCIPISRKPTGLLRGVAAFPLERRL